MPHDLFMLMSETTEIVGWNALGIPYEREGTYF